MHRQQPPQPPQPPARPERPGMGANGFFPASAAVSAALIFASVGLSLVALCFAARLLWTLRRTRSRTLVPSDHPGDHESAVSNASTMERLTFAHIDYWVPRPSLLSRAWSVLRRVPVAEPKQILSDVSGSFTPGSLTAIMGPSGCGKTTLLNLLCGRTKAGTVAGSFLVNDDDVPFELYRAAMCREGYVLQTDLFYDDLTAEQILDFTALLKRPQAESLDRKKELVQKTLRMVGLGAVANNKVSGFSGGQRRRLSIAVELMCFPRILFLDEPTSGLDSLSSLFLVQTLKALAKDPDNPRMIITTIHQPRSEIVSLFDNIMLLGNGGRVIYFGSTEKGLEFLQHNTGEAIGSSPGDFISDIIGDAELNDAKTSLHSVNAHHIDLVEAFRDTPENTSRMQAIEKLVQRAVVKQEEPSIDSYAPPVHTTFLFQVQSLLARQLLRSMSSWQMTLSMAVQLVLIGMCLGVCFSYGTNKVGQAYKDTTFIFVVSSYVMILQYLVNVPEYFDERRILLKETENGTCTLHAYFASVFLRETPRAFFQVAVVTLLGYSAVGLNPGFKQRMFFFIVLVMGTFAWRSCVTFFSFVTDSIGLVYSLLFLNLGVGALLGGFLLTRNNIPPFLRWGYYASIPSFTQRSLVLTDLSCCHLEQSCEDLKNMVVSFVSTETSSIATTFNCTASAKINLGPYFIDLLKINDDFFPWNVMVLVVAFVLFHVGALLAQHARIRLSRSLSHKQHAQ
eukprot:m51a1_g6095 hypothetical protein (735) ;mRNA; f:48474-51262